MKALKRILAGLCAVLLTTTAAVSLAGCNIIQLGRALAGNQAADEEKTVTSTDGRYRITVPGDWEDEMEELGDQAVLAVGNRLQEKYLVVLTESKEDFESSVTLEDYRNAVIGQMEDTVEDALVSQAEPFSVNGRTGYLTEVRGTMEGINITYWVTCLETNTDFVQITGWTLRSREEKNGEEIRRVEASFQEASKV